MLIDFHTHVLPAIDDGSQSVTESWNMLKTLYLQNVCTIVASPHFYSYKTNLTVFLQQRTDSYSLLLKECPKEMPEILLGAEVSFFRGIGKADRITELTIADTKLLLLEMPFAQWGHSEIVEIHKLLDRGITPVIAHVERYYSFQKDLAAFNEIVNLPVVLQVNTEALLARKTRKFVFKLIEQGFRILLGTDCHNMKNRRPEMAVGRKILERKFGTAYLEQLDALGAELLKK